MNIKLAQKSLASTDKNELSSALKVLKTCGTLSDIQSILPLIKHTSEEISKLAKESVCTIIKDKLIEDFNDLPEATRTKLATLMESLDPTIVKDIAGDLFTDDRNKKVRAVQIIGLLKKNPQIRTLIAKLVTDRDEHIRATAATLLQDFESQEDQQMLMSLLNDKDMRVRANTVETLENTGNKRMVPILKRFRKVDGNRMRGNVIKAIYNLGFKDVEDDLLEMLNKDDEFMIATALWVITQIKLTTKTVVDKSAYFLISTNEMVLDNSQKALKAINTPKAQGFLKYLNFESHIAKAGDNNSSQYK